MKIKKRLIGLLAAVSLAASLCTPAYASYFIDDEYIQYKTAVGVISGVGVINGYENNSFRPNNTITREEAVKMITYALLGPSAASKLTYTSSRFSDIEPGRWSASMVEWCAGNKIVAGRGDGTFDPTGKVTTYEMAKMLLCAAGYGKNGEYTGGSWDLTVVKDAFSRGIFESNTNIISGYTTREQAALYIFNTIMNVELVEYKNGAYVPVDGTLAADNTIAEVNFGLTDKAIISGVITSNSANGKKGTNLGDINIATETGAELLGHQVSVYTNGKSGSGQSVYYIADNSQTVKLIAPVTDKPNFTAAFGKTTAVSINALVFDKSFAYLGKQINGFDSATGTAPAGTYVIYDNTIISYTA
ncbi:MAG: S-layer homology domain-containing protein [Oscillospiraceae bacterium]